MKTPHKHAELIKAWADGAVIQFQEGKDWMTISAPSWSDENEYRIKPGKGTDIELDLVYSIHEIKLTWDASTGKLKSAEVI